MSFSKPHLRKPILHGSKHLGLTRWETAYSKERVSILTELWQVSVARLSILHSLEEHTRRNCSYSNFIEGARTVIVEAEELVEIGDIPPEQVHLPGLYVNRLFIGSSYERRMDFSTACATTSPLLPTAQRAPGSDLVEVRELIARVVAQELVPGTKCNLGVGIPTLAAGYAAEKGVKVFLQGENGVLGCGPYPAKGQEDHNWTNAGSESITPLLGASTFGSDESFAQIRGGHLDMTILGVRRLVNSHVP